jgi:hypothetical protein
MRRWEYMTIEFVLGGEYQVRDAYGNSHKRQGPHVSWRTGAQSMQDALHDFGMNGWEMCGVAPSTANFGAHIVYFKRMIAGT